MLLILPGSGGTDGAATRFGNEGRFAGTLALWRPRERTPRSNDEVGCDNAPQTLPVGGRKPMQVAVVDCRLVMAGSSVTRKKPHSFENRE